MRNLKKFRLFTIAVICALNSEQAYCADTPAAGASDDASATPNGWTINPEMLTPVDNSNGTSSSSTPGLSYTYKKDFGAQDDIISRFVVCTPHCPTLIGVGYGEIDSSGKVAANPNVNVGDMVDLNASGGYFGVLQGEDAAVRGFFKASGQAALEYGQRLSTKNYTYGVDLTAHFYPDVAKNNSAVWPLFVLDFQRVDPADDTARKAVDPSLSDYNRAHVGLTSTVGLGNYPLPGNSYKRTITFSFAFDHWKEISPSAAIQAADLDRQTYRQFELLAVGEGSDPDYVISYGSGSVPTDQSAAKVIQVGLKYKFK